MVLLTDEKQLQQLRWQLQKQEAVDSLHRTKSQI